MTQLQALSIVSQWYFKLQLFCVDTFNGKDTERNIDIYLHEYLTSLNTRINKQQENAGLLKVKAPTA